MQEIRSRAGSQSPRSTTGKARPVRRDEVAVTEGASDGCTCLRLRSLTRLAGRRYDAHLAAVGLKTTQYSLLSALLRAGPMRATRLAHLLALEPSTLTRNVEPLIQAGWVEALVGEDRRTRVLGLTPAGVNQRRLALRHWTRAQLEVEQLLGNDTVARLHQLLDQCRDVFETDSGLTEASDSPSPIRATPTAAPAARPTRFRRNGAKV